MKSLNTAFYRFGTRRSTGLLVLATLGILITLIAGRSWVEGHSTTKAAHAQAQNWLISTGVFQQAQLAQAQLVLQALSGISLSRPRDATTCNAFLARQLERFPQYNNLAFTDTLGRVWCRAKPLSVGLILPAVMTRQKPLLLALAENNLGFALPRFAADGRGQGAVIAIMPTQEFFPPQDNALPDGGAFGIFNTQGTLLATFPPQTLESANVPAINSKFWQATQPVVGAAGELQLSLHLPAPRIHWKLYGALGLILVLSVMATWRLSRQCYTQAFTHYLQVKLQRLIAQRSVKTPSNTEQLRGAYAELKGAFLQKEARVQQLVQLDELSQRLQSCGSTTEWADTIARCAQAIFPDCHGALYLRANAEHYGLALAWGGSNLMQTLQPRDCHALYSHRPYVSHGANGTACAHAKITEHYACLPLQTSTEPLGLLYLAYFREPRNQRRPPWAATAIAERATIGLTALRRQEQLHLRAIRDALTGLFNRGFMEEALAIERQRALRRDASIGIMMLDVDHFKRYNDSFGHAAGDTLLRGIGKLIQRTVREGDMPCRYGGEEFVVIMPGADLDSTQQRAEVLRLAIEHWCPESGDSTLGAVTVSIGVAVFPVHGMAWQTVLKCADQALYAAKHAGRNRVVIATQEITAVVTT